MLAASLAKDDTKALKGSRFYLAHFHSTLLSSKSRQHLFQPPHVSLWSLFTWKTWGIVGKRVRRIAKTLWMMFHAFSPWPLSPSWFYKLIPTWMKGRFALFWSLLDSKVLVGSFQLGVFYYSSIKRGLRRTQISWEHRISQGNRCVIPLMQLPTGCHYHFPLFRAMSFQCTPFWHSSNTCPTTVQTSARRQTTRLPFPCHAECKKTAPLALQVGGQIMVSLAIKHLAFSMTGIWPSDPRGNC